MAGQPRAFKSVKDLAGQVEGYFEECSAGEFQMYRGGEAITVTEPLTVSGLASHLGIDRMTLFRYGAGEYGDEYCDTIKKARARIERDKVAKAMLGIYDRTICIFDLKNNHGWKDRDTNENGDDVPLPVAVSFQEIDGRKDAAHPEAD